MTHLVEDLCAFTTIEPGDIIKTDDSEYRMVLGNALSCLNCELIGICLAKGSVCRSVDTDTGVRNIAPSKIGACMEEL